MWGYDGMCVCYLGAQSLIGFEAPYAFKHFLGHACFYRELFRECEACAVLQWYVGRINDTNHLFGVVSTHTFLP